MWSLLDQPFLISSTKWNFDFYSVIISNWDLWNVIKQVADNINYVGFAVCLTHTMEKWIWTLSFW